MATVNKRIYRSKSEKLALISKQKSSNLTVKAFCEKEGFHVNQFYLWKRQIHFQEASASRKNFIELSPPQHSFALEILLPNGILIRSNQPEIVLSTVTALQNK